MHRGQGGARPTDLDGLLEAGDRVGDAALLVLREEISSLGCLCLHHRHLGSKRIQGSTGCLGRLALWLQPLLEERQLLLDNGWGGLHTHRRLVSIGVLLPFRGFPERRSRAWTCSH